MDIIVPPSKKNSGWKIFWIALAGLSALAAAFAAGALIFRGQDKRPQTLPTKLELLETDVDHLLQAMDQAEELADRGKYLEIARKAAEKNLEADEEWRKLTASKKGLQYGLQHGIFEEYIHRFTEKDKVEMLAAEHKMTPEELNLFRSELEMVFFDDYLDKFGGPLEAALPADGSAAAS